MEVDYYKDEINLRRLVASTERLVAGSAREIALEAIAASAYFSGSGNPNSHYKSPYVISLFKKVRH